MKANIECIPCIFNQAFRAGKAATEDDLEIRQILDDAGKLVKNINLNLTPPEAAMPIYKLVEKITGVSDPYKNIKREQIETALQIYSLMKRKVEQSNDPLKEAIKIAIVGNVIDLGSTLDSIDIEKEFKNIEKSKFILNDLDDFKNKLSLTYKVLYLADNAGETVFDRPLIEELQNMGKTVLYVVKEKPIINDATKEDAVLSGIKADIISTGSEIAGTVLKNCSKQFLRTFYSSSFIIAKGQGNYETLSEMNAPIFFLFKIKCNPIAKNTGFPRNSMLLLKSKYFESTT